MRQRMQALFLTGLILILQLEVSTANLIANGYQLGGVSAYASLTSNMPSQCFANCLDDGACKGANYVPSTKQCGKLNKAFNEAGVSIACNTDSMYFSRNGTGMTPYALPSPQVACLRIGGNGNACPKPYQTCRVQCVSNVWSPSCTYTVYSSCSDAYSKGERRDGVYMIKPDPGVEFEVYCQMSYDPTSNTEGGYIVAYRRRDATYNTLYPMTWANMVAGFGDFYNEFFLGLEKMNRLSAVTNELLVWLRPFDGDGPAGFARYSPFRINSAASRYSMYVPTYTGGNAGECLQWQTSFGQFSTFDSDNTPHSPRCSTRYQGPGWFYTCHCSNPFGRYLYGYHTVFAEGMEWSAYRGHYYSYQHVEYRMK